VVGAEPGIGSRGSSDATRVPQRFADGWSLRQLRANGDAWIGKTRSAAVESFSAATIRTPRESADDLSFCQHHR
jgi:hypothetical protein